MRIQNICAVSARNLFPHALFLLVCLILCAICATDASALVGSVSNTEVRDRWTVTGMPGGGSYAEPITNDLHPDDFVLYSTRSGPPNNSPISSSRLQFPFPANPLVMHRGDGEGMVLSNNAGPTSAFHNPNSVDQAFGLHAELGTGKTKSLSVAGLVWNALADATGLTSGYYFSLGDPNNPNGDGGFQVRKRSAPGAETTLFSDLSIALEEKSRYGLSVLRDNLSPNDFRIVIDRLPSTGFGGPAVNLVDRVITDGNPLGRGGLGLYVDNLSDNQWDNIMVPEPNTFILAGMGVLGILIFLGLRHRQMAVHTLL